MRVKLALACALALALAAPAGAETAASARQAELERMFKALRTAPDAATAGLIEAHIRALWMQSPSPAAAMLMARGERDLHAGAAGEAVDDFDAVLDLEPNFSEGYERRAVARAAMGDYAGAVRDIEAALAQDPRNFFALQTLSRIAEQQGNWQGALEAWRRALDIDPRSPGGAERLEMLQKKVEGEPT